MGSVKGHIGHTECTSGMASLLKAVLMCYHGTVVPTAMHKVRSPKVRSAERRATKSTSPGEVRVRFGVHGTQNLCFLVSSRVHAEG